MRYNVSLALRHAEMLDVDYLVQPRGPGTAWQFRMRTPAALVGVADPVSGRVFGKTIKRGLGTAHMPTAAQLRDEVLGEIRRVTRLVREGREVDGLSDEQAAVWRTAIAEQENRGGPDGPHEPDVRGIVEDMIEAAASRPSMRAKAERFKAIALRKGLTLEETVEAYLEARGEGNRAGYKALALTTVGGVRTATKLLCEFLGREAGEVELREVGADEAHRFMAVWMPARGDRGGRR